MNCPACGARRRRDAREQLLRQAQQGYEEIGAPRHAARLARELLA